MKKLLLLLSVLAIGQHRASAQYDSAVVIHFDHSLFIGASPTTGGIIPRFTDPGIEAITNKYLFTEFDEYCQACSGSYFRDIFRFKCSNTAVASELRAAYPSVFSDYNIQVPILVGGSLGVTPVTPSSGTLLFPNPAGSELSINSTAAAHLTGMTATDVTGRRVAIINTANKINTAQLTPGLYIFNLSFDDRSPVAEQIVISNH
ncbi:MAG: hypothetical protein JWQ38_738 [Flavipsychrobacter sp.]|nr:hypothetical protein [Flavipsychrobacter sp.]